MHMIQGHTIHTWDNPNYCVTIKPISVQFLMYSHDIVGLDCILKFVNFHCVFKLFYIDNITALLCLNKLVLIKHLSDCCTVTNTFISCTYVEYCLCVLNYFLITPNAGAYFSCLTLMGYFYLYFYMTIRKNVHEVSSPHTRLMHPNQSWLTISREYL